MRWTILMATMALACAKVDTSEPGTTTSDQDGQVRLTGAVAKGPFVRGSSVDATTVDASGTPTGQVFPTQTSDDAGRFSIAALPVGPIAVEATGYYYNEVTGRLSDAPITLRAWDEVIVGDEQASFVNLLTHLSSQRVATLLQGGASMTDAVTTAESEIRPGLGIGPVGFDPGERAGAMDLLGGDGDANAYLFAVSTVLAAAAAERAGPGGPADAVLTEMINGIAGDLADGALDGGPSVPTSAELHAYEAIIDADEVMALLADRFAEIGSTAAVPDLHRILDLDLDGMVDAEDTDADGDGHDRPEAGGDDCDDHDADTWPGAPEAFLDGVDRDCTADTDGDGHDAPEAGGDDCDDGDPAVHPGATEIWYDGTDQDCDGASDFDQDADGHDQGDDCDDMSATVHPGAPEDCLTSGDDDCDGGSDDPDAVGCLYEVCATAAVHHTIQSAVDAAAPGAVLRICPGSYAAVDLSSVDVELRGEDRATTVIDGGTRAPAVRVDGGVVALSGLTLTGSTTAHGGVAALQVANGAVVTVTDASLSGQRSGTAYTYVVLQNDSDVTFDGVVFEDNQSAGLVEEALGGSVTVRHSVLRGNDVATVWNFWHVDAVVENNLISGNTTVPNSMSLLFDDGLGAFRQTVTNNTITGNTFPYMAVNLGGTAVSFTNNIVAANGGSIGVDAPRTSPSYNDVWGHTSDWSSWTVPGSNNLSADPLFMDSANGDFTLSPSSPCIDSGSPDLGFADADASPNDLGAFGGPGGAWTTP